jgi:thioredoxin reductase (NADPH)
VSAPLAEITRGPADSPLDALIVGGGPAGLSAAVYLGRARRSVVVVDCPWPGRSDFAQVNHNYLGFSEGVPIVELCRRGRQQAERFGAQFIAARVEAIRPVGDDFEVSAGDQTYRSHSVILATGVADRWVHFPGYDDYIGRSLHWCSVCDGYEMQDQRVVVIGNDDEAAEMAMQLTRHADQVTVLTNDASQQLAPATVDELAAFGIPVVVGRLASARAKAPGFFAALILEGGLEMAVDHVFSAQGAHPKSELVQNLGVRLTDRGYIEVDTDARTSVEGIYAAGDLTGLFAHQVLSAAHQGASAAMAVEYALFQRDRASRHSRAAADGFQQLALLRPSLAQ